MLIRQAEFHITADAYLKFLPIGKNLGERSEPDMPCCPNPIGLERPTEAIGHGGKGFSFYLPIGIFMKFMFYWKNWNAIFNNNFYIAQNLDII